MRSCKLLILFLALLQVAAALNDTGLLEVVSDVEVAAAEESVAATVDEGKRGGVTVVVEEKLKRPFQLHSYKVSLDGNVIADKKGKSGKSKDIVVDSAAVGPHTLSVSGSYAGTGYGVFDYHSEYDYPVTGKHGFKVDEGKITNIRVVFSDRGGFLEKLEERPFIDFEVSQVESPFKAEAVASIPLKRSVEVSRLEVQKKEAQAEGPARKLTHLKAEKGKGWTKVTLRGDGSFDKYNSFTLKEPSRVVIDLLGVKDFIPARRKEVATSQLRRIRLGKHEDKIRVVLDLSEGRKVDYKIETSRNSLSVYLRGK